MHKLTIGLCFESFAGLFLLEMGGAIADGLILVLLPTAGRGAGVKTMQGSHHAERGLYL